MINKIQLYQHEVKKLETEMSRIKKQMTKILDEKTTFNNSYMELKSAQNMKRIAKAWDTFRKQGEIDFIEMLKSGFDATYNTLVEENNKVKNWLLNLQTQIEALIGSKTKYIWGIKSKFKESLLKEINMKLFRLKIIDPASFKLCLTDDINAIESVFHENLDKFSKFIDAFINPDQLFEFIDTLNSEPKVSVKMGKIKSLSELRDFIIMQWDEEAKPKSMSLFTKIVMEKLAAITFAIKTNLCDATYFWFIFGVSHFFASKNWFFWI